MRHGEFAPVLALFFFLLAGCSQPLRTLMELGREQKAQQDFVAKAEAQFERLRKDISSGRLTAGELKENVLARYGEPVLEKTQGGGQIWLYRFPVVFLGAEKVYLSFDARGRLEKIEVIEGEDAGT